MSIRAEQRVIATPSTPVRHRPTRPTGCDRLQGRAALAGYHLQRAARADLLRRLGRREAAAVAYAAGLALVRNRAERLCLERLHEDCLRSPRQSADEHIIRPAP